MVHFYRNMFELRIVTRENYTALLELGFSKLRYTDATSRKVDAEKIAEHKLNLCAELSSLGTC